MEQLKQRHWVRGGPPAALPCALMMMVVVAFGVAALLQPTRQANAAADPSIAIDMQPTGNRPSAVAAVQPCTAVDEGDEFAADVVITNVDGLTAWELRVEYDPDVVRLKSADYDQLLVSAQPSGSVFPSLLEEEKPGRQFLAATEINGTPDSGSGVLAHLLFEAVSDGRSPVTVLTTPHHLAPRLTGLAGASIGDPNGDGLWDGTAGAGEVAVGDDCAKATPKPTVTPKPATTAKPTAKPTTGPRASGGAATDGTDATEAPGSDQGDSGADGDQDGSDSGSGGSVFDPGAAGIDEPGGEDQPGGVGAAPGSEDDAGEDGTDEDGENSVASASDSPGSGGDGTSGIWLLGGAALACIVAGGVILLFLRRRLYT